MRKVRGAFSGFAVLAAFGTWSMLAAVAATPAAAQMRVASCPASCDATAETCVASAVCAWRACADLDQVLNPNLGLAVPVCEPAAEPAAEVAPPLAPAPSVGQCLQELSASVFKCEVQHAICEFICEAPAPPPRLGR
jgi:hypothetical protein